MLVKQKSLARGVICREALYKKMNAHRIHKKNTFIVPGDFAVQNGKQYNFVR